MPLTPQDFVSKWKSDIKDEEILEKLLALNLERGDHD